MTSRMPKMLLEDPLSLDNKHKKLLAMDEK